MKIRESFVTNSSSSSFLCNIDMDIEDVEIELRKMVHFYNDIFNKTITYDDMFSTPYKYTKEMFNEDKKSLKKDKWDGWEFEKEENIGKIFINSSGENTIPYELFDLIESRFNAWRYPLG